MFGTDYPYHYAVAQLHKESLCRNVLSRDGVGSEGYAQITYRVWEKRLKTFGINEVRTTSNNLRAQAIINKDVWDSTPHKKLWVSMQIYNGGYLVLKEIDRAGAVDWQAARDQCKRRIIRFNNGQERSACDINYEYSKLIFKYGEDYRRTEDSERFPFW